MVVEILFGHIAKKGGDVAGSAADPGPLLAGDPAPEQQYGPAEGIARMGEGVVLNEAGKVFFRVDKGIPT
jgi:hypothetical protein